MKVAALIFIPFVIGIGQILFKLTSQTIGKFGSGSIWSLAGNIWFISAIALYGSATVAWIFAIKDVPIGRAYMFMALTFIVVPIGGWLFLGEGISLRHLIGIAVIVVGIYVASTS